MTVCGKTTIDIYLAKASDVYTGMVIKEYASNYIDRAGLVSCRETNGDVPSSDNGILFTAEFMRVLAINGFNNYDSEFMQVVRECIKGGILYRAPNHTGQDSIDNHIGLCAGLTQVIQNSKSSGIVREYVAGAYAKLILDYGRATKVTGPFGIKFSYVYNNENPGQWNPSAWLGRFPQMIACLQAVAGEKVDWWRRIWANGAALWGAFCTAKTDTDGKILSWLMLYVLNTMAPHWSTKLVSWIWNWRVKLDFPNGMKQVFEIYFGPSHPTTKFMPDNIFS